MERKSSDGAVIDYRFEYAPPDQYSYHTTNGPIFVGSSLTYARNCSEGYVGLDKHYRESVADIGNNSTTYSRVRATVRELGIEPLCSDATSSRPNTAPTGPSIKKLRSGQYTIHNTSTAHAGRYLCSSGSRHYRRASDSETLGAREQFAREQVMQYDAAIVARISKTGVWKTLSWKQRLELIIDCV